MLNMAVVIEGKGPFIKLLAKWSCLCNLDPKNYLLFGTYYVFLHHAFKCWGTSPSMRMAMHRSTSSPAEM